MVAILHIVQWHKGEAQQSYFINMNDGCCFMVYNLKML